ncbi:hypothetical protein PIB30_033037 [Stylosanthes scabra]|uniref:Putative plant transposon protein domain-containing protein n=1 Tax=Stylosanthes scabra TaxID=79078 RepID=A0ABU6XAI3_9FABA|nr:hypothetical protein [Stylosanthes scabra]
MSRRRQTATDEATPSRVQASRNSSRGRDEGFPANLFDHQVHFDWWKGLENRDIMHERIVHLDGDVDEIFRQRLLGLGWGFMYDNLVCIHVTVVHAGVDDTFVTLAKTYATGEDMNMEGIYATIGREDNNWADNLAVNLIPKNMNSSILNPRATAWHKIIMANIDPKTHGTKFDMKHALLIYVLMIEGAVNLPRIMRDILLVRPMKHLRHLLPFPVFITRLANHYEVPEFPNDKFHTIRPVDMYVPYGDWRGEKARAPARQRRQPPPQDRQIVRTQAMIRRAFPQTDFTGLGFSSSSDISESQDF